MHDFQQHAISPKLSPYNYHDYTPQHNKWLFQQSIINNTNMPPNSTLITSQHNHQKLESTYNSKQLSKGHLFWQRDALLVTSHTISHIITMTLTPQNWTWGPWQSTRRAVDSRHLLKGHDDLVVMRVTPVILKQKRNLHFCHWILI